MTTQRKSRGILGTLALTAILVLTAGCVSNQPAGGGGASGPPPGAAGAQPATASAPAPAAPAEVKPAQLKKVTLVNGILTASPWPIWVAHKKGFFERYGLDVKLVQVDGGTTAFQAFIGGSAQVALGGGPEMLTAAAQGGKFKVLAVLQNNVEYNLLSRPGLDSAAKLKGGKLAISKFGSTSHMTTWLMVDGLGLDPDKDVVYVQVGGSAARAAALQSGAIDAAAVNPAFGVKLEKEMAFHNLVQASKSNVTFPSSAILTSPELMKSDPELLKSILKATMDAIDWLYDPANLAEARQILAGVLNLKLDDPSLTESVEFIENRNWAQPPRVEASGFLKVQKFSGGFNPKILDLKVESYLDNSLLDAVLAERKPR